MNSVEGNCDVIVVVRDHYGSTTRTVRSILETTPEDVTLFVVAGMLNERQRGDLLALDPNRIAVIGPRAHLIPNVARNLGLSHASKRFVAFADNDIIPEAGWLRRLVEVASRTHAVAVRPILLERRDPRGPLCIHECGGVCRIDEGPRGRTLFERHHLMHHPVSEANGLVDEPVGMLEFHCMLFDREKLNDIGGFDPTIESAAEHLDLALRISRSGGEIWLAASSRVSVEFPHIVRPADVAMFVGRWSSTINQRSKSAFNAKWGITDPDDSPGTWSFDRYRRSHIWLPVARPIQRLVRRGTPLGVAVRIGRFFGRYLAEIVLRVSPGWRTWRQVAKRTKSFEA